MNHFDYLKIFMQLLCCWFFADVFIMSCLLLEEIVEWRPTKKSVFSNLLETYV